MKEINISGKADKKFINDNKRIKFLFSMLAENLNTSLSDHDSIQFTKFEGNNYGFAMFKNGACFLYAWPCTISYQLFNAKILYETESDIAEIVEIFEKGLNTKSLIIDTKKLS